MRYIFPCELAARRVVPSIRAGLVTVLRHKGYNYYQISKLLNLTPAAVSQYVSKKRGGKIVDLMLKDQEIMRKLELISELIIKGESEAVNSEICSLCELVRRKYPEMIRTFPY
ncbi:MAG: hypothetical protein QW604_02960 [Fervidicoccaceae archaeon]|jgi:predicted transcriptional regulator|uniref:Transcriptional regulator n=1 Tax=Fervidicoccus fontis TaxID=683846 RepID=A0A7C1E5D2_9CREN